MDAWVDRELGDCTFPDRRLKARLGKLLGDLGRRIGGTVPAACQDWAATKAAYRFFSNPRVDEGVIPACHVAATASRVPAPPSRRRPWPPCRGWRRTPGTPSATSAARRSGPTARPRRSP